MALYLRNSTLRDEEIVIRREDQFHSSIADVRLERCRIVIDQAGTEFGFGAPCDFTDCFVVTKKPLKNFQVWTAVRLRRCKFVGTFIGNDFGHWSDAELAQLKYGCVEDCDFTDATLDGCRFLNVSIENIRLAPWPQFILPYPGRAIKVDSSGMSTGIRRFLEVCARNPITQVTAVTDDAFTLCKYLKVTEEELKAVLHAIETVPLG